MRTIDLRRSSADDSYAAVLPRPVIDTSKAAELVAPILHEVKEHGAPVLYDFAEKFDKVRPPELRVPRLQMEKALRELDPAVLAALEAMIANTRATHQAQLPQETETEVVAGGLVYQRWLPLGRVGLYAPGGLAVYPSSVVMNVVAAQVAGVGSIVVASPPQAELWGLPHPTVMAACELLGVDELIAVGGAQAVAALAYGFTDQGYTCRPVDKITGPGNIYVTAAKRLVQDTCAIDAEAGTTEIAVLADATAPARYVAADLISQAEHDPAAASVLVTDSEELATQVEAELPGLIAGTLHEERIKTALSGPQSAIILVRDLSQGIDVIEAYGPEHLEVITENSLDDAFKISVAGAIFVGPNSPVPLGDYMAGSNHVLPTGGTARYASGLNATQFLRSVQVVGYSADALASVTDNLVAIANAEGLPAHAQAATVREGGSAPSEVRLPFRAELSTVQPYGAPQLDVAARLNVNENPYSPASPVVESVIESVRQAMGRLNRYADRDAVQLRKRLAEYLEGESAVTLDYRQIWAANGSNEVMLQLLQAFGGPGRTAMGVAPTYSMYEEYARDTNTSWVLLNAGEGLFPVIDPDVVVDGLKSHRPAVILLPSPANPTGTALPQETVVRILEASAGTGPSGAATIVVIDEAYAEFREPGVPSALELLDRYPHLVVTRTMSKAFAAAGLRLGYMAADKRIVDEVQKVRLPYHLSLLTQAAAIAALGHADEQMAQVAELRHRRDELAKWLTKRGYQVAPSSSNFLLFGKFADRQKVWQGLLDRGVLIRVVGPEGTLRVTVGTESEIDSFKQALIEVENE